MSDQKVCPTCGTEYPLSERFCPRDGTALRSASGTADLLGSVVADRYHITKKLGEGGMGTVYLAEHVKMGRKSALKVMNPGMNTDPDAIARFNREASNASRLNHPNICAIYDFGETPEGLIYLAMEFIEGKALTDLIEVDGMLAPPRAASIVHQTADALQVAHDAGIVHRDLKPDNIMVTKHRDGSDLVKVVDFGIAKASSSDAQKVTKTGLVVGTPEYMSPEQLAGDKLDGRSDLYSLALVAFNCLTGMLPFPSETAQEAMIMRLTDRPRTLAEMRPDREWPAALQEVMDKGLARDVGERYQSAAQFGRDFAAAIAEMPATQVTEGATMVIGAQGALAASAKTKPVPATRIAGRDEARAPAKGGAAVSAPKAESKGKMVPIIAGVAVVAVAGFFGVKQFAGGAASVSGDSTTIAQAPPPNPGPESTPTTPAGGGTETPPSNPQPVPPRTDKSTAPTTPTTTTSTTPAVNVPQRLSEWLKEIQDNFEDRPRARRVLQDLDGVQRGLVGRQLGEWHFVEMHAFMVLGDSQSCRAARDVKRLLTDPIRVGVADQVLADPECTR